MLSSGLAPRPVYLSIHGCVHSVVCHCVALARRPHDIIRMVRQRFLAYLVQFQDEADNADKQRSLDFLLQSCSPRQQSRDRFAIHLYPNTSCRACPAFVHWMGRQLRGLVDGSRHANDEGNGVASVAFGLISESWETPALTQSVDESLPISHPMAKRSVLVTMPSPSMEVNLQEWIFLRCPLLTGMRML